MHNDTLMVAVTIANAVFTTCRIAAHVPQLIAVVRDRCGASAISVGSWILFTLANASNAVYALVMAGDWTMFGINGISTISCAAIAIVAWIKQARFRAVASASASASASSLQPLESSASLLVSTGLPPRDLHRTAR